LERIERFPKSKPIVKAKFPVSKGNIQENVNSSFSKENKSICEIQIQGENNALSDGFEEQVLSEINDFIPEGIHDKDSNEGITSKINKDSSSLNEDEDVTDEYNLVLQDDKSGNIFDKREDTITEADGRRSQMINDVDKDSPILIEEREETNKEKKLINQATVDNDLFTTFDIQNLDTQEEIVSDKKIIKIEKILI
jgi:hypothetical protein